MSSTTEQSPKVELLENTLGSPELDKAFALLPRRFAYILQYAFGLYGEPRKNLSDIAADLSVTYGQIYGLKKRALRLLENRHESVRRYIAAKDLLTKEYGADNNQKKLLPSPEQLSFRDYLLEIFNAPVEELFPKTVDDEIVYLAKHGFSNDVFSNRARNSILRSGINNVRELAVPPTLSLRRGIGSKSAKFVRQLILDKYDIDLDDLETLDIFSLEHLSKLEHGYENGQFVPLRLYKSGIRRLTDIPGREHDLLRVLGDDRLYCQAQEILKRFGITIKPYYDLA